MRSWVFSLAVLLGGELYAGEVLTLLGDDLRVDRSCVIRIPAGHVVSDANRDGVIHIVADNIRVEFERDAVLRGAPVDRAWDELEGVGVRVDGRTNVTLAGLRVHGFKVGLWAGRACGLTVDGGDFSDNYRQRLRSTPEAEDGSDWLYPHRNDTVPWREQYGAALCVERSRDITIRGVRVRRGQNGIILDQVEGARIYDNDCSFLSGWGLALWRSSNNVVSRNAFDFCVRGHVEGVYNRGQDSAGILCFEQSSHNVFAYNSATHGGDGFFAFAGREAIGEVWWEAQRERLRRETGRESVDDLIRVPENLARDLSARGCNNNLLFGNDFSYSPAHGIEITFSEGNRIERNRLVENAICGIWGGYSSGTLILNNELIGNGGMAYGLERGGINMEHASDNWIQGNEFLNNKCAIHFWWDDDAHLLRLPGVAGNAPGVSDNVMFGNRFTLDARHPFGSLRSGERLVVLQMRDDGGTNLHDNVYANNQVRIELAEGREFDLPQGYQLSERAVTEVPALDSPEVPGRAEPVGARRALAGRSNIIMDEWGPWDHEGYLVRPRCGGSGAARFDLFGFATTPTVQVIEGAVEVEWARQEPAVAAGRRLVLRATEGVTAYRLALEAPGLRRELSGTIVAASWSVTVFPWTVDPREDLAGWRAEARGPAALEATVPALNFPYGWGGPRDQKLSDAITQGGPGPDRFGMIAKTRLRLPAGRWELKTLSDDGVRVTVDDRVVIENWTWHGPTWDRGVHVQPEPGEVEIEVEHFEIDGYAVLVFELEMVSN
jgi:parallel beta-helix repeat protein